MDGEILIVEDDPEYALWLNRVLATEGFKCSRASSLRGAAEHLQEHSPDLVLLDEGLPDGAGTDFCRRMRKKGGHPDTLVALLTGNRGVVAGTKWFEAGADTCWSKTSNGTRIATLVKGLVRRSHLPVRSSQTPIPELTIDWRQRVVVFHRAKSQRLSHRELLFLEFLIRAAPEHVSRTEIHQEFYATNSVESFDLALNEFVRKLRLKLPPALMVAVQTVHGYGYRFGLFPPRTS